MNIATLDDFKREEHRIVERINAASHGPILFLADPLRALKDLNVILTAEASRALAHALQLEKGESPVKRYYDDFKRDVPDQDISIRFRRILPPTHKAT